MNLQIFSEPNVWAWREQTVIICTASNKLILRLTAKLDKEQAQHTAKDIKTQNKTMQKVLQNYIMGF